MSKWIDDHFETTSIRTHHLVLWDAVADTRSSVMLTMSGSRYWTSNVIRKQSRPEDTAGVSTSASNTVMNDVGASAATTSTVLHRSERFDDTGASNKGPAVASPTWPCEICLGKFMELPAKERRSAERELLDVSRQATLHKRSGFVSEGAFQMEANRLEEAENERCTDTVRGGDANKRQIQLITEGNNLTEPEGNTSKKRKEAANGVAKEHEDGIFREFFELFSDSTECMRMRNSGASARAIRREADKRYRALDPKDKDKFAQKADTRKLATVLQKKAAGHVACDVEVVDFAQSSRP